MAGASRWLGRSFPIQRTGADPALDFVHDGLVGRAADVAESPPERITAHVFGQVAHYRHDVVIDDAVGEVLLDPVGVFARRGGQCAETRAGTIGGNVGETETGPMIGIIDLLEQADGIRQRRVAPSGQRGRHQKMLGEIGAPLQLQAEAPRPVQIAGAVQVVKL